MSHKILCTRCWGGHVDPRRALLQQQAKKPILCMDCGETAARSVKHCSAPLNKSSYMLITNPETLKQLNPKRTT